MLIIGGILIDGTGADPMTNAVIRTEGDRIVYAGPADALPDGPPDKERLDATGCAILPGLMNLHTHINRRDFSWNPGMWKLGLEYGNRIRPREERREAAFVLTAIAAIKSGKFDKHFVERNPELLIDSDGDAYWPQERGSALKGEYQKQIRAFADVPVDIPMQPVGITTDAARKVELGEKVENFKNFIEKNPDWRREELKTRRQEEGGMPQ